jgi:hypothetical protein
MIKLLYVKQSKGKPMEALQHDDFPAIATLVPTEAPTAKPARSTARSTQINVRLEPQLKQAGDAALTEVGLSPSEVVRSVWSAMAARGERRERLLELLGQHEAASAEDARTQRMRLVERIASRYEGLGKYASVDPHSLPPMSAADWDELAWQDYAKQREA